MARRHDERTAIPRPRTGGPARLRLAGIPGWLTMALMAGCSLQGRGEQAPSDPAPPSETPTAGTAWEGPDYGERYRAHWRDGNAELAGYALTFPRYGEPRTGTAVAVFVAEPFDPDTRVKPEDPTPDHFDAFKLNLSQDFPTGIYDYHLMTSAFVQLEPVLGRPPGAVTKVSFGAQEWCGHVYQQALFDADGVRATHHSYFEGEADGAVELPYPQGGFAEDALLLWARGLAGPVLAPGDRLDVPLLRSLTDARLHHLELTWDRATLARSDEPRTVEVPAGTFEVSVLTATVTRRAGERTYPPGARMDEHTRTWTFHVERDFPHRVVRWTRDDGIDARLTGSTRAPYWRLNAAQHGERVRELGLEPRPPRTP
jgi:hypothetical protein